MNTREKKVANNRRHLIVLIEQEIAVYGESCDLNHIDTSQVEDMFELFKFVRFNGDISRWNVSNVKNMAGMFSDSDFNGDISGWDVSNVTNMKEMFLYSTFKGVLSKWNVSNVKNMESMFYHSKFDGDISQWNVEKVEIMDYMFSHSSFTGELNCWKPYHLIDSTKVFNKSKAEIPYWAGYKNTEIRALILDKSLTIKEENTKKHKI